MNISLRPMTSSLLIAIATYAAPALAQNAAAPAPAAPALAATAATSYGTPAPAARAKPGTANRNSEAQLLGAPRDYGSPDAQQGNTADAQQAALLDEQRMTVLGGARPALPAVRKGQQPNKAQAAANGKVRVAGQPGRPNAADGLMPEGAAKNTYADPYNTGKHAVYKSPW
ncbi:hypothetical protein DSC91_006006 [Paraburkholderia caffeinilytica]|uniref:Uncharacterized protein n=2 Tax=Paraburkholderia caffeinilytica TaxID=1761016 RepID=A0ABQ1N8H5_9BURK|nr:hypothetical protein DSC91_006006 [Paraburkholderia caffeinilytica]GGC59780.1 hypothetical protein GCM10011400_54470 [Paraburkholderia caffeinilytica]